MRYTEESCESFVKILGSNEPTPGGGGASALAGALGTALGHMTGSLTVGKKRYQDVEEEIRERMAQARQTQSRLLELVQEDAEAFAPLAAAYRLPSETEEQKKEKERIMEEALKEACRVPFEIMRKCCEGIELCGVFAEKGSTMAISDAGAGASFCRAALESASFNVYINTKSMKDRKLAEKLNREADEMRDVYMRKADAIIEKVFRAMK